MSTTNGTHPSPTIPNPTPSLAPLTGAATLRHLLSNKSHTVLAPGIYDGLTARIALSTGHQALYMTGAGTSLSRLGLADLGLTTQTIMLDTLSSLTALSPSTPIIADADTGYGGPLQTSRTVAMYARAGCAALHIEDQVEQKRCGHLLGKELVEREVWYGKLRAAVRARDAVTPGPEGSGRKEGMMIFARTDARQSFGMDEALARIHGAVIEGGVDGLFFEAIQSVDEARQVIASVRDLEKETGRDIPVLLNVVAGGDTPELSVEEAREIGFRVVIVPMACMDAVIDECTKRLTELKETGRAHKGPGVKRAFNLCGLQECMEIDRAAGGKAYSTVGQ